MGQFRIVSRQTHLSAAARTRGITDALFPGRCEGIALRGPRWGNVSLAAADRVGAKTANGSRIAARWYRDPRRTVEASKPTCPVLQDCVSGRLGAGESIKKQMSRVGLDEQPESGSRSAGARGAHFAAPNANDRPPFVAALSAAAERCHMSMACAISIVPPAFNSGQPAAFLCASARLEASIRL